MSKKLDARLNFMSATIVIKQEYKKLKCVYKVIFNKAEFYIGSTKDLKNRLVLFNSLLSGMVGAKPSKYLAKIATTCECAEVEIIEIISDASLLRVKEDSHLQLNADNPLLLNRSKNAFSNKGIKWTSEERTSISNSMKGHIVSEETRMKMSLSMKKRPPCPRQPKKEYVKKGRFIPPKGYIYAGSKAVIKYSKEGIELKKYNSMAEAERDVGCSKGTLQDCLSGRYKTTKGFVFKYA